MSDLPFACRDEDGAGTPGAVIKRRAIQCALSRICGICGETLSRPIAFVGPEAEVEANRLVFPPLHLDCARDAAGAPLGHENADDTWRLVTTAGFDLVRPTRRGDPVHFSLNSVLETSDLT